VLGRVENAERHRLVEREAPHEVGPCERRLQREEPAVRVADHVTRRALHLERGDHHVAVAPEMERVAPGPRVGLAVAEQVDRHRAARFRELHREGRPVPRREPRSVYEQDRVAGSA